MLRQEPDDEAREATAADGTVSEYTWAGIVREIFVEVAGGTPLITIEKELNARGVPSSEGKEWRRGIIRKMAMNPAYIGKRVLRGEVVGDGLWDGLVDEEIFWACVRLLEDPSRTTTRAGRAVHLLSYIAQCAVCDGPLSMTAVSRRGWTGQTYSCLKRRCVAVMKERLDEYVQRAVVAWLAHPDVFEILSAGTGDAEVAQARAQAQKLRAELDEWRGLAGTEDGPSLVSFARAEKNLMAQIAARRPAPPTPGCRRCCAGASAPRRCRHGPSWATRSQSSGRSFARWRMSSWCPRARAPANPSAGTGWCGGGCSAPSTTPPSCRPG